MSMKRASKRLVPISIFSVSSNPVDVVVQARFL